MAAALQGVSLRDFVERLDKQDGLGLSEREVDQVVLTLEEQWFSDASELASLDSEAFRFLDIPSAVCDSILNYFGKGAPREDVPAPPPAVVEASSEEKDFAAMLRPRRDSKDLNEVVETILSECSDNEFVMAGLQNLLKKSIQESGKSTMKKNVLAGYLKRINAMDKRPSIGGGSNVGPDVEVSVSEMEAEAQDEAEAAAAVADYKGDNPCGLCKGRKDKAVDLECHHSFCKVCLHDFVMGKVNAKDAASMKCPKRGCNEELNVEHIQGCLTADEFNQYLEATLLAFIEQDNLTFPCPNGECKNYISIEPRKPSEIPSPMTEKGNDGQPLTPEAWLHFAEFRVRCNACSTVFCADCKTVPYHKGYTCSLWQEYQDARHCRFCASKLTPQNLAQNPPGPGLRDVCTDEECLEKRDLCCARIKECGCPCNGVRDEDEKDCMPCMKHDLDVDPDEFCCICYVESLKDAPTIQVGNGCEHVFHYQCVKNKLAAGYPGARISFDYFNCPLCHKSMEFHPALQHLIKPLQSVKDRVEDMALERLKYEGREKDPEIIKPDGRYKDDALGFALHSYLFYMCFQCKKPYFAGGYQCQEANAPFDEKELICPSCQPSSGQDDCPKHGKDWLAHKCRYCCTFANWYCWGRTHFCGNCHKSGVWQKLCEFRVGRNKKKLWEYPQCDGIKEAMQPIVSNRKLDDDAKERAMEALAADPARCPLKVSHPPNGIEFGLGCSMCEDKKDEARNLEAAAKARAEAEEKKKAFQAVHDVLHTSGPGGHVLRYQSDMDKNGLIWFLATCAGTAKWSNPAESGYLAVSSSGMMGDSTPLSWIVGRDVGRCVTKPIRNSWIQVDLKDLSLEPTHYTIRHYSSWDTECLRNWVLEGSNDGLKWITLMHHRDDKALNRKGEPYTWPIRSGGKRFRIFRLVQTGVNSNNHYYLACSGLEFYGTLYDSVPEEKTVAIEDEAKQTPARMFAPTFDFDTNGIFYYLGTQGGTQPWKNPALLGEVIVTCSELASKPPSMPAHAVVGRSLVRCVTMARPNMWFALDLKDKRCRPTHYSIKHYNSWDTEALRNWRFEGSNDGQSWVTLRAHHNDAALNAKGATCTWKIPNCNEFYSMFRVFQFGKNSNNHYYLACSGMELYGELKQSPPLRVPQGGVTLTYSYDFDCNGLFYWLGTRGCATPWRNAAMAGLVTTTASSLASNPPSHPPSAIVGRSLVRCATSAAPNQWFVVDLKDKAVQVTHYTLRHYNSWDTEALRNWLLEGSNDGFKWVTLREHKNDWALDKKGATFTWEVAAGNMRFRMLRLRQTGLNSNNHHYLACSGFEVYGTLYNASQPDLTGTVAEQKVTAPLSFEEGKLFMPGPTAHQTQSHEMDKQGLLYWLGTDGLSKHYRNPGMMGIVKVNSSPLASQSMPCWAACGREVVRCVTEPKKNTWFCFDFGNIFVVPTYYTLRHYDSWDTEALRNWKLEGSVDGKKWKTLMTHKKDKALDRKGMFYTWQIKGITKSYSMFKITQTGKNSNKHWYLSLSGFELYGRIYSYRYKQGK